MKVAIIEPVGGHRGMNFYDYGLSVGLVSSGIEVFYYTCNETSVLYEDRVNTKLLFKEIYGDSPIMLRALRFVKGVVLTAIDAKRNHVTLAHIHTFHFGIMELVLTAVLRLFGFSIINTIHDIETFEKASNYSLLRILCFKMVSRFIVHNVFSKVELEKISNIDSDKIEVIPHGNYLPFIEKNELNFVCDKIKNTDFVILFFGQIKEVKGLDVLLKAFAILIKYKRKAKLIIAGTVWKDIFTKYQSIINDNNLQDYIILENRYIPDQEVSGIFDKANIVVLPYRRIYQSGVLIKSMSYGKPVMVSNLRPMMEIVEDGVTGLVFESENAEDLATKLVHIIEKKDKLQEISLNGYRLIKEQYDWNQIGAKTKQVYKKTLD